MATLTYWTVLYKSTNDSKQNKTKKHEVAVILILYNLVSQKKMVLLLNFLKLIYTIIIENFFLPTGFHNQELTPQVA